MQETCSAILSTLQKVNPHHLTLYIKAYSLKIKNIPLKRF